ncbi:TetR/AcrR family transcriptional regulator [Nocardia jinanensis]|uniref:TetR/AcrR family transcriptional regulator n=1 Tax=Nocardia jinanensis TaxID=382504 RepID=UPI00166CC029|nr:TetR/AcrR family transcriptional regulator [Nocardia jinanensis]
MSKNATQTWERILDGALVALARRGQHKFSMTDVCAESGVSRGTLYRYFASKEDVIAAVEERLETSLREHLTTAIAERPEPADRLAVIAEAMVRHRAEFPAMELLTRTEPGMVLDRLASRFDALVALMQECLHPALAQSAQVQQGAVTKEQVARIVVLCGISFSTLPPSASTSIEELTSTLEGLLGIGSTATKSGRRLAG